MVFGDARDALFVGIIVTNSAIGIFQEVRAKRALDRLSLLVAPRAGVRREGHEHAVPVEEVVVDDECLSSWASHNRTLQNQASSRSHYGAKADHASRRSKALRNGAGTSCKPRIPETAGAAGDIRVE